MVFLSLVRNFDYVESRLHLGNTKKKSFSFGISLDLHYLCTRNQNVDRFGLLATTVKNAKTTKNSLTIGVCFCLCIFPNSFPIRFIDDLTTSDCR